MWKHVASNAMTMMIVVLVLVGGMVTWAGQKFVAEGPMETAQFFEIASGSSLQTISRNLGEQGVVQSPAMFRMGAKYREKAEDFKYGNYEIPAGASMAESRWHSGEIGRCILC